MSDPLTVREAEFARSLWDHNKEYRPPLPVPQQDIDMLIGVLSPQNIGDPVALAAAIGTAADAARVRGAKEEVVLELFVQLAGATESRLLQNAKSDRHPPR